MDLDLHIGPLRVREAVGCSSQAFLAWYLLDLCGMMSI